MAAKWAVIVVHGVGETGPGSTVDNLLPALAAVNPNLRPSGTRQVLWLEGPVPPSGPEAKDLVHLFPVHVRHATVDRPGQLQPDQAVFAEVYWADLSRIREGVLNLVLGLLSTVFLLGCISDQATALKELGYLASTLRFLLHAVSWLLYGPIAAVCAFLAWTLAGYYLLLNPLKSFLWPDPASADPLGAGALRVEERGMFGLSVLAVLVGAYIWWRCRKNQWGSTWTRFWSAFVVVALVAAVVVGAHNFWVPDRWWGDTPPEVAATTVGWMGTSQGQWPQAAVAAFLPGRVPFSLMSTTKGRLGIAGTATAGVLDYAAIELFAIELVYFLLAVLMLLALLLASAAWVRTFWSGNRQDRPALEVAYGAVLVQVGLWLLILPPLARLALKGVVPTGVHHELDFLKGVWSSFVWDLGIAFLLALFALVFWWLRAWRTRRYPGPYGVTHDSSPVWRLVVHRTILVSLIVLCTFGNVRFLRGFLAGDLRTMQLSDQTANAVVSLVLALITVSAALLVKGLRDWLHIVNDIVNHFYRRREDIPWPWQKAPDWTDAAEARRQILSFETQQLIETRFRKVLDYLLEREGVTHLAIVAHSQGTVIAVDVLCMGALDNNQRTALKDRLNGLKALHLVTMGSPFSHLYQHYFPTRYPPLEVDGWQDLRSLFNESDGPPAQARPGRKWVNIYRLDDFIGTNLQGEALGGFTQYRLHAGGHTDYWSDKEVLEVLRTELLA